MKKLLFALFLLSANLIHAQADYSKVLNLLINNKRQDARKQFDKEFGKTKQTNVDLLFLDAFIDQEMGQIDFDETFVKSLEKLPNTQYFIPAFANNNIIIGDITKEPGNDLTFIKVDFLAASPKFGKLPIVTYRKAVMDQKRFRNEEAQKRFDALGQITQWQYCGVFENLNGSGLDIEYEPESHPKSDQLFDANSNGKVGWYVPKTAQNDGYHFFGNESEFGNGIVYAQTFIQAPEKKDYILSFGANSGVKIFLNDKEIYVNQDIKNTNLDAYAIKISLDKGYNRLLFKADISGGSDYFSAQVKNLDQQIATDLKFSAAYQNYTIPTGSGDFTASEIALDYESYFDDLVKKNPNNVLYRIYQFSAYKANNKKIKAFEALEDLEQKYPNSSFLSSYFLQYYAMLDDGTEKGKEIMKNIESNDKEYYLIAYSKLTESDWLKNCSIQELEKYRDQSKQFKQRFAEQMYQFMITSRKVDVDGMFNQLNQIIIDMHHSEKLELLAATMYAKLKNDRDKTVSLLEALAGKTDNYETTETLLDYYNDMNRKDDVKKIQLKRIADYNYLNTFRTDYIQTLINENDYANALKLVDENLSYFPYSFTNLAKKATIYSLMKNDKEAEKYIRQSLTYNSGDQRLRNTLYDITKTPDEIEGVAIKNLYDVIKDRRKSTLKSNYGVVTLLDQYIVNIFPEGGRKIKAVLLYEITSDNGIEEMKEYSINTYRNKVVKSEIVKADGSIVPAEKGDGTLVFPNLKVGDVVYIEYDSFSNPTGRFYKDFNVSSFFNSYYPSIETTFTIINPSDLKYDTVFNNGNVNPVTKKVNNKVYTTWTRTNIPAMDLPEDFSPVFDDLSNTIYVGTIKSWSDISSWYADLVKRNIKADKITKDTFVKIFPQGTTGMAQENVAKKIYEYIESNVTYSSLDFRQSGYVPQKPSKTITTKLGDCKDLSTLFLAFSDMAGLKANLVLVSTNDNGFKKMPLPSSDFNHCIVKVNLDGKDVFLELTDKFLQFKALPRALYHANALVISFDKNEKSAPIAIPFDNAVKNTCATTTIVTIDDTSKTFKNVQTVKGASASYYNKLFSNSTSGEIRKNNLEKDYKDKLNKVVNLESFNEIPGSASGETSFESQFSIAEKPQSLGSLKITNVPFIDQIYTRSVISEESRKYDISYYKYENSEEYESTVILNIPEGKKFTEFPENKTFAYKGHNYSLAYDLVKPNSLKVTRKSTTPWNSIKAEEYPAFKKYVESIIESEETIIGYK